MPFDTSSYPTTLTGLTEREAIADCLYRATLAFDHNDHRLFRSACSTSTPTVMQIGDQDPIVGVENIIERSVDHVGKMDTQHLVSGIRIDVRPDAKTASLTCNALNQHFRPGDGLKAEKDNLLAGSLYEMEFVKEDDGWKIAKWVLKIIYTQGTYAVFQP